MLSMYQQITVKTLHKQGVKHSEIARQLGCHRNTVTNILERKTVHEKYFDNIAKYYLQEESVLSPENYARNAAQRAMPNLTASYLNFTNLPISEKGGNIIRSI